MTLLHDTTRNDMKSSLFSTVLLLPRPLVVYQQHRVRSRSSWRGGAAGRPVGASAGWTTFATLATPAPFCGIVKNKFLSENLNPKSFSLHAASRLAARLSFLAAAASCGGTLRTAVPWPCPRPSVRPAPAEGDVSSGKCRPRVQAPPLLLSSSSLFPNHRGFVRRDVMHGGSTALPT